MDRCDVVIVGGGPAGSSCAWALRKAGLDVVVVDKQAFPRDKVCAGWITPALIDELELDIEAYRQRHVLQPITGFRVGLLDGPVLDIRYGHSVSYGIRRCEFDDYLLRRSGARLRLGEPVAKLTHNPSGWVINDTLQTPMIVGAGGHFCPVARFIWVPTSGVPSARLTRRNANSRSSPRNRRPTRSKLACPNCISARI